MNSVIPLLEIRRRNRRVSRPARTLVKACKRIRNEPMFSDWQFTLLEHDPRTKALVQDYLLGFVASPKWAEPMSEKLIVMARRSAMTDGKHRPRAVEYVIKELSCASPGMLWGTERRSELVFTATVEPIRLAGAFIATARVWEEELRHRIPQKPPPPIPLTKSHAENRGEETTYEPDYLKQLPLGIPAYATLADYEHCLARVLPDARFLGRIEMSEARYHRLVDLISIELVEAPSPLHRARRLARNYPSTVAYALIQLAAEEYKEGEVWPVIANRLGGQDIKVVRELGLALETCRQRYDLAECSAPRQLRYVTQMLFQAGVPDSCIDQFINLVFDKYVRHGEVTPRAVLSRLRTEMRGPYWRDDQLQVSEPIVDFLESGGTWAEQWVVITAAYLGSSSGLPRDLQRFTPTRLLEGLRRWSREQVPSKPSSPKRGKDKVSQKEKALQVRRATIQTHLDVGNKALILHMGEQVLSGDFDKEAWLQAILRGVDGTTISKVTLEASRARGGITIRPTMIELPVSGGPFQLDIDYGGDVLESYSVPSLDTYEVCSVFANSGKPLSSDILRNTSVWVVLPFSARIVPETAVKFRETFSKEAHHDLVWLDLRECENQVLMIESDSGERLIRVRAELFDEEVERRGGQRVHGAFTKGCPIYAGVLPEVRFLTRGNNGEPGGVFRGLRIGVEMLDDGMTMESEITEMLESFAGEEGWVDLNLLTEYLGVHTESALKVTFRWQDALGLPRDWTLVSVPEFLVDFAEPVFIPQRMNMVRAEVIAPPGWQFEPIRGATVVGGFDDVIELELDTDATVTYGWLGYRDTKLPVSIELPIAQWRLEDVNGIGQKRWTTSVQTIWIDEIEEGESGVLAVMVTSPFIHSIGLEVGSFRITTPLVQGEFVTNLDLSSLPEIVRREGSKVPLYLSFYGLDAAKVATIQVATLYDKWIPEEPKASIGTSDKGRQVILSWTGVLPRHPMIVTLRPAWDLGNLSYEARIEAGSRQCFFDAKKIRPGPYYLDLKDERDVLWDGEDDPDVGASLRTLVWVVNESPGVEEFHAHEEGSRLHCVARVIPSDLAGSFVGVVLRDGLAAELEEYVPIEIDGGKLEFMVDNSNQDISVVGIYMAGNQVAYRFIAVGRSVAASRTVSRTMARYWLELLSGTDKGLHLWIVERNVRPMPVSRQAAQEILVALASPEVKVNLEFPLSIPSYAGPVDLVARATDESEFDFSFRTMLVECTDPNCLHPPGAIPQNMWDRHHYPRCKGYLSHKRTIRARLVMEYDVVSLIQEIGSRLAKNTDYLNIVADSSFRPFTGNVEVKHGTGVGSDTLIRAYRDLGCELSEKIEARKVSKRGSASY